MMDDLIFDNSYTAAPFAEADNECCLTQMLSFRQTLTDSCDLSRVADSSARAPACCSTGSSLSTISTPSFSRSPTPNSLFEASITCCLDNPNCCVPNEVRISPVDEIMNSPAATATITSSESSACDSYLGSVCCQESNSNCISHPRAPTRERSICQDRGQSKCPQPPGQPLLICSQAPMGLDCCHCKRCFVGGCDLKMLDCGCCMHARCCPFSPTEKLSNLKCPICGKAARGIVIIPMSFLEIDFAQAQAVEIALTDKRGKKRRNATVQRLQPQIQPAANLVEDSSEKNTSNTADVSLLHNSTVPTGTSGLRAGRWTNEEVMYCDKLIDCFEQGKLPLLDGTKLNDFLSKIFKSKPSRLTKRLKNAKLSMRQYHLVSGYITDYEEARKLSVLETNFFASIKCEMERSEIRFHMQKEWRELFSTCCTNRLGQSTLGRVLEISAWLQTIDEFDRRLCLQNDAVRMQQRKIHTCLALTDGMAHNEDIKPHVDLSSKINANTELNDFGPLCVASTCKSLVASDCCFTQIQEAGITTSLASALANANVIRKGLHSDLTAAVSPLSPFSSMHYCATRRPRCVRGSDIFSPFVDWAMNYVEIQGLPFEYVDAWVPSLLAKDERVNETQMQPASPLEPRLCFAGCAVSNVLITYDGESTISIPPDYASDLHDFAYYSQSFTFDVGRDLAGRVYQSGQIIWEQCVNKTNPSWFERCFGANHWGIRTVLGIPVASPSVGRIVVLFYSRFDRPRDDVAARQIFVELNKWLPLPQWKLVVDLV